MIISPNQIKESTVKIIYNGEGQGTGFFVSPTIIITTFHIFLETEIEDSEIKIIHNKNIIKAKVLSISETLDLCIIKTENKVDYFLPLKDSFIRINEDWETFGFINHSDNEDNTRYTGKVDNIDITNKYDVILKSENIDSNYDYSGLSGSPIVSSGYVVGVALHQSDDKIECISIGKAKKYLNDNNIQLKDEKDFNKLPHQIEKELEKVSANYSTLEEINECIIKDGNWIVLTGNPGSGKSTNVATFEKAKGSNYEIVGKYFVKIPNSETPISVRASANYILKWFEDIISVILTGTLLPKDDKTFNERVERLSSLFSKLNDLQTNKKLNAIFFIDGLDDVNNLEKFLGILPYKLPKNIKVVLSCTSINIIPNELLSIVSESQVIKATPLERNLCEYIILKEIGRENIDINIVQKVALKSEGHPLYLRYLIDSIVNLDFKLNEEWIDSFPEIDGDIKLYYKNIWSSISADEKKLWICLTVSQTRQPIKLNGLKEMLPSSIKTSLLSVLPSIRHLFYDNNDEFDIYHSSFGDFILSEAQLYLKDCNDNIYQYCLNNIETDYSISNLLYHLTLSNNPNEALQVCNQDWADKVALNHITPDLVLLDIKKVIEIALSNNDIKEIIRLLLLLQRIEFRYDYVLYEYASEIALYLISIKQFKNALKYIIRDNILLIHISESIHFLQLLYEAKAFKEANILLEVMNALYRNELDSDNGIVMSETFVVKAKSIILAANEYPIESNIRFVNYIHFLASVKNSDSKNDSLSDVIKYCSTWQSAYMLRIDNYVQDIKAIEKERAKIFNENWAKMFSMSMSIYDELSSRYNSILSNPESKIKLLTFNIQYLMEKYNYEKDVDSLKIFINSLYKRSKNVPLVKAIIEEFLSQSEEIIFNLRDENGVDINYAGYNNYSFYWTCKGYLNEEKEVIELEPHWYEEKWENAISSIIKQTAYAEGQLYRFKAENKSEKSITKKLSEIYSSINFSFYSRSQWKRSYQIPEDIFPYVYSKLINLINIFDNESLSVILDEIIKKTDNQLSLYSEGYRKVLSEIIKELIIIKYDIKLIQDITKIWRNHVLVNVQNRWERTQDLLNICEVYGLINDEKKSISTFNEVINTSMGPTWYKEAQFGLLNSVLAIPNQKITNKHIQDFASLLDYSSGEMTFQEYNRFDKENFIGGLIKTGNLNQALEYYKNEVLPSPKQIINNAEFNTLDAPIKGEGYILGGRNISEHNGILNILENIVDVSPYLKWALIEIFVNNQDNFLFIHRFGKEIAKTLNQINSYKETHEDKILNDLAVIITDKTIKQDDKGALLKELNLELDFNLRVILKKYLLEVGITWEIEKEPSKTKSVTSHPRKTHFDDFNIKFEEKKLDRKELILLGKDSFDKAKVDVWFNNWSDEQIEAKENLKSLFKNKKETIDFLKKDILHSSNYHWKIVSELIWFLKGKLTNQEGENIVEIISQHFQNIVRPDENSKQKFEWVKSIDNKINTNETVTNFIIWLLNNPTASIREKTKKSLINLCLYVPNTIQILLDHCIKNDAVISTVISSIVLLKVSEIDSILIEKYINKKQISQICELQHLTVKYNFLTLSKNLSNQDLYNELYKTIPEKVISKGEVILDEDFLSPISIIISKLNDEEYLDRKFCEKLISIVKTYSLPLKVSEYWTSDQYLIRSFYNKINIKGRYNEMLIHSLNVSIMDRIDRQNINLIYQILNNE